MIKTLTVGMIQERTYFLIDENTKHCFVIDPGDEAKKILDIIERENLVVEKILITHGHYDHIGAAKEIKDVTGCKIIAHKEGKRYLEDPVWNLSAKIGRTPITLQADIYVEDGDTITMEANKEVQLKVIFVPGHSADGVAYYYEKEKALLAGDILFNGSVGRTDNLGGDMNQLLYGIKTKLFTLPEDTYVYPGHGMPTTIKKEKATNPFFNLYD